LKKELRNLSFLLFFLEIALEILESPIFVLGEREEKLRILRKLRKSAA